MLLRATPIVLLVLAGAVASGVGCSNGTTPVCDDAGSCLIVPPSDDAPSSDDAEMSVETGSGDAGVDAPAE
jgi:hypothetical protein